MAVPASHAAEAVGTMAKQHKATTSAAVGRCFMVERIFWMSMLALVDFSSTCSRAGNC